MAKKTIPVPDIGGFTDVPVIDVYISSGDEITEGDALIALESSKAVMDVPAPFGGRVAEVLLKEGDTVSEGDGIAVLETAEDPEKSREAPKSTSEISGESASGQKEASSEEEIPSEESADEKTGQAPPSGSQQVPANLQEPGGVYHATPAVRQFARRVGVDISQVTGTGPKGRILPEDVEGYIHRALQAGGGRQTEIPEIPQEDYTSYGPVEKQELSRIKKISGPFLQASWRAIPHVTHFDEADVTELEGFRASLKQQGESHSILSFIIPAVIQALKEFPSFNASLDPSGESIILKRYYHIGIAVDTPQGLVVPVLRDADKLSVRDLTHTLRDVSSRAREGKLGPKDLQGGSFSISSLGGIGGTGFTPIIKAPETAILGVSAMKKQPVWNEEAQEFTPRLIMPFSVTYDHRAIDGAEAARFTRHLSALLEDFRRVLL